MEFAFDNIVTYLKEISIAIKSHRDEISTILNNVGEESLESLSSIHETLRRNQSPFRIYVLKHDDEIELTYDSIMTDDVIYIQPVEWKFDLLDYFEYIHSEGDKYHITLSSEHIKTVIEKLSSVVLCDVKF